MAVAGGGYNKWKGAKNLAYNSNPMKKNPVSEAGSMSVSKRAKKKHEQSVLSKS